MVQNSVVNNSKAYISYISHNLYILGICYLLTAIVLESPLFGITFVPTVSKRLIRVSEHPPNRTPIV